MDETIGETIGCNFLIGFLKSIDGIYCVATIRNPQKRQ